MMNKLESHVVSLEIAKLLKEAGWKKETEFWWEWGQMSKKWDIVKNITCPNNGVDRFGVDYYPAPLATEILEELPRTLERKTKNADTGHKEMILPYDLRIKLHYHDYPIYVGYIGMQGIQSHYEEDNNVINALAKMWLYLKKENLL